ncbi:MAG: type II toxin-antitoxin system PrlF family antitoxin [Alphaproteobacteria bacterium]|nr:type II toxin-antitoxin system PrlF family antitoxin [Alphaproteobacteria bacterium]
MESALTSKGQATIPKAIRDHLHLRPGDRVKFFVHPDGTVVLLPKLPPFALRGVVKPLRQLAGARRLHGRRGACSPDRKNHGLENTGSLCHVEAETIGGVR